MFAISVVFAFFLLFYHSLKLRGWNNATKIFLGGVTIFVLKELENQFNIPIRYETSDQALRFAGVPVIVVMGWIFAIYIGWQMAELILARFFPKKSGHVFPIISLASIITFTIALTMEVHGTQIGWWNWTADEIVNFEPDFLGLPLLMPMEWARVCFTCLSYAFLFEFTALRYVKWRHVHFLLAHLVTAPLYFMEYLATQWTFNVLDNPVILVISGVLFLLVAYNLHTNYKTKWANVYLFTLWLQIYNFYIDPFSWVAGSWIILTIVGYFLYNGEKMDYGQNAPEPVEAPVTQAEPA